MKTLAITWLAALAAGLSAPALAQPAAPHQHGQPAAAGESPEPGGQKAGTGAGSCDCCAMMTEMMQKMRAMDQHASQAGPRTTTGMMPSPASPAPPSAQGDAEHRHEDKPRD